MNGTGQNMLEEILTDPLASIHPLTGKTNFPGGYGVVSNTIAPNGTGFITAFFNVSDEFVIF